MSGVTLKERRVRLGMTQQRVAQMLGVSQQTVARWESGGEVPSRHLKDLAIILVCRVGDLVGEGAAASGGSRMLRMVHRAGETDEDDAQVPYGTARAVFIDRGRMQNQTEGHRRGRETRREYPISEGEMKRLHARLQEDADQPSWFAFDTLDNRLVLLNRSELELFELVGDDVTAMPTFAHEEVYAALSDSEMCSILESGEVPHDHSKYSAKFVEACRDFVRDLGGIDEVDRLVHGITLQTLDGEEAILESDPDEHAYERIGALVLSLALGQADAGSANERLIELSGEGYYRSTFYRLGALRLIEVPLYAYEQAMRVAFGEADETSTRRRSGD